MLLKLATDLISFPLSLVGIASGVRSACVNVLYTFHLLVALLQILFQVM
jgi:hypothetical protein